MTLTPERMQVADWTLPFEFTSSTVAVRSLPADQLQWSAFLKPFTWQMYLCTLCALVGLACLLHCLVIHQSALRPHFARTSFFTTVEYLVGSLLQEAMVHQWTRGAARVVIASWCMLGLLLSACYTSKLTSLFVDVSPLPPFASRAELVQRDDFRWGIEGGTSLLELLRNATDPATRLVNEGLQKFAGDDPDVMSTDVNIHMDRVLRGNYAFLGGRYAMLLNMPPCGDVVLLDEAIFGVESYVFYTPKNSTLTTDVNKVLLGLQDSGILPYLRSKWFSPHHGCQDKSRSPQAITIATMQGPCYAAVIGLVLAAGALLIELAQRKWKIL